MSRQGKRSITVEYQRSNLDNDRGSPSRREAKYKQTVLFHVESAPNVTTVAAAESPKFGSPRSARGTLTSSLESLNSGGAASGLTSGGLGSAQEVPSFTSMDGDTVEFRLNSSASDRSDVRHSASPEKSMPLAERSSRTELSVSESSASAAVDLGLHNTSASFIPGLADKKSDSMSDSTSDKDRTRTLSASRHSRERSFERSLDNILDRCSEKSLDLNLSVDSWNGTMSEGGSRSAEQVASSTSKNSKADKKKKASWYSGTRQEDRGDPAGGQRGAGRTELELSEEADMLSPTYKSRSEDFRKTFKDIPRDERLLVEYSCAMQKDILVQGRMYISQNWVCFYANIFRWETVLTIPFRDITAITKEKTARVIPNAIQITTATEKYFFTSFGTRDKTYMMLFRTWQNVLMEQPMLPRELWQWIHYNYGEELGLTSSDDDYLPPPHLEDSQDKIKPDDDAIQQKELTDSSDHPAVNDSLAVPSNEDTDALVSDEVFNQSPSSLATPLLPSAASMPTDYGDTTDDSDSEVACSGHDHLEKLYLDEVFNLNVDKVFENIFTDSPFFRLFVGSRRTFDLNLPSWGEPDEEGNRVRNITYTLTLNNSIGPRTSPSTEKQVCYKESQPGRMYCVDCEIYNGGIPYGDSFYNVLRYCLTRVNLTKCRVRVTSDLRFRKSVMGMFKSMIEKSAVNGLTDYFRNLSAHLRREAERQENHLASHQHQPSKKKLRRRRKPHVSVSDSNVQARAIMDRQTSSTPPSPVRGVSLKEEGTIKLNADMMVRVIIIILIFLVLCNAVLFYKLWAIEASTSGLYSMYSDEDIDHLVQHPRSQEEWAQLLRQQRSLHHDEVSRWQDILHTSVQLLDHMKQSLTALQNNLQVRSQTFPSPPPDNTS